MADVQRGTQAMQELDSRSPGILADGCQACAAGRGWLLVKLAAGGLVLVSAAGLIGAFGAGAGEGQTTVASAGADSCSVFDHDHAAWSGMLRRYVDDGFVDYAGLARSGRAELDTYLRSLESVCRSQLDGWTRHQKLAFWINAYNAYTVKLILDHYPLSSIRSIGLLPGAAFRETFIPLGQLRGRALSLSDIEHEILRRDFREPRIHFAIVCASRSCPTLRSEAYRAGALDAQLEDAARTFIRDASKNRFDAGSRTLHLSSIFDWFREDFERGVSLPRFVARYADPVTAAAISSGDVRVRFLDYDWSLNGR